AQFEVLRVGLVVRLARVGDRGGAARLAAQRVERHAGSRRERNRDQAGVSPTRPHFALTRVSGAPVSPSIVASATWKLTSASSSRSDACVALFGTSSNSRREKRPCP